MRLARQRRRALTAVALLAALAPLTPLASAEPPTPAAEPAPSEAPPPAEEARALEAARLRAEAERLDRLAAAPGRRAEDLDLGGSLVQMTLAMGAVALLAYLLLGKLLPRLMKVQTASEGGRLLSVVDRMPIDQRRSLMIVRMGERFLLLGVADQEIRLLTQLEPEEIDSALSAATNPEPLLSRWGRLFRPERQPDA